MPERWASRPSTRIWRSPRTCGSESDLFLYAYKYLTGHKKAIPTEVKLPNVIATTATANDSAVAKYYYISGY